MNKAILSILVSNHFGVLTKVTGLFGRRGFNIKALSVGETDDPSISRITILTEGDEHKLNQIYHQVSKIEEVKTVAILPSDKLIERELILVKLRPESEKTGQLMQIVTEFAAKTTAAQNGFAIIEASGKMEEMDRLIGILKEFNIVELSRTGATALALNEKALSNGND